MRSFSKTGKLAVSFEAEEGQRPCESLDRSTVLSPQFPNPQTGKARSLCVCVRLALVNLEACEGISALSNLLDACVRK